MIDARSFSLEGRRALVTGGATGIGAAIARAFAACGADIAVTVHTRGASDVISEIGKLGRRVEAFEADLSTLTEESAAALVESFETRIGPLDVLVNNAGIIRRAEALDHSWADWRDVMATDLDAAWLLSQAAARKMAVRRQGCIVNIASVLSFQGGIRVPGYAAAKHGLVGLTKALANEWAARGINVNAVAPGYVTTENNRALREDAQRMRELVSRIPIGRFAEPDEIAGAVVFLASPAAGYVNGAVLAVDGGWLSR